MLSPTPEQWIEMRDRAVERVCQLEDELAREREHLKRCDAGVSTTASSSFSTMTGAALDKFVADYLPKVRTCNLHTDCDKADLLSPNKTAHCHDDCCEDCFGS